MEKEKPSKSKLRSKILKLLPKAATAVTFQNPPFSPGRAHSGTKGFSGPIVSIIPEEARRKPKTGGSFETQEPTSPKISCMGKIKQQKKVYSAKKRAEEEKKGSRVSKREEKKKAPVIRRMFTSGERAGRESEDRREEASYGEGAPSLSQLKRFASGRRDAFDWTAQIAPEEAEQRNCFSDEEKGRSESDEEEEESIIPFSAPIMVGGGLGDVDVKPRKEVNLWKRRTMAPPRPLQLNPK